MKIRFVLSNNRPGSVTRIAADTANIFVRRGIPTEILFPAVDWWDYKLFILSRLPRFKRPARMLRLLADLIAGWLFRRSWCGLRVHSVDPRVQTCRYLITPSAAGWTEEEITLVHPPYLLPHLLRMLPSANIRLITALHVNLEKAMNTSSPETAAWYVHWTAFQRLLSVPTILTSEEAKEAAQRLGIRVDRMIPGGIDLQLFHPPIRRDADRPLTVTLYCDPNRQKGRDSGVEALRSVKRSFPEVRIHSLGWVSPDQARDFDHNYGYLHGEEYARVLRESDLFVYPSLFDGFPAPPLQAMASGAALVTTAVEGVALYARDGENCLLCRPGDVEGMSRQVARLIEDRALRERLQRSAPEAAGRFSAERSALQLLDYLQELCPTANESSVLEGAAT